jgi:hypothetical protein
VEAVFPSLDRRDEDEVGPVGGIHLEHSAVIDLRPGGRWLLMAGVTHPSSEEGTGRGVREQIVPERLFLEFDEGFAQRTERLRKGHDIVGGECELTVDVVDHRPEELFADPLGAVRSHDPPVRSHLPDIVRGGGERDARTPA